MVARDVVDGGYLYCAFDEVFGDSKIGVCLIYDIARDDDNVRVSFFNLLKKSGLLDPEKLVMKVRHLNYGEFRGKTEINLVIGGDEVVVLVKADDADDYL